MMEASTFQQFPNTMSTAGSGFEQPVADMDIDMDIDLDVDPETAQLEAEAMKLEAYSNDPEHSSTYLSQSTYPPTDVEPAAEKVHIRGLDELTTADLKTFISEHSATESFVRVEWIDDTSANFVYDTPEAALDALAALSDHEAVNTTSMSFLDLRPAKKLSIRPESGLQIRQALKSDVKRARAHEASRFYLLNPDHDPWEKRKDQRSRGRRYSGDRGDYRRRRFDEREHKRRRDGDGTTPFDVSMYDDDAGDSTNHASTRRRDSQSSNASLGEDQYEKRVRFGGRRGADLFSNKLERKSTGRLRNRSASPGRDDGDGDGDDRSARRRIRQRSLTPPPRRYHDDIVDRGNNTGKELFPSSGKSSSALTSNTGNQDKELFPSKVTPSKTTKELFPNKTAISNHRRTAAFDAADETAGFSPSRKSPTEGWGGNKTRDLMDRITRPVSAFGRLQDQPEPSGGYIDDDDSFVVRGTAQAEQTPGFSIRGASRVTESNPPVKELFPLKTGGNVGKELFSGKIKGRGGPRQKAEDMYF